jgi:hypothetical protein
VAEKMKINWPKRETTWMVERTLFVSVPFTWRLPAVRTMLIERSLLWDKAIVGGPAIRLMPSYLSGIENVTVSMNDYDGVLQMINSQATRTTVGCPNQCAFCAVPKIEGKFRELESWSPGPIICDNNLLAASVEHFDSVMDQLEGIGWCDFNQGLDCRLLTDHHAERIGRIKKAMVRVALDSKSEKEAWSIALEKLLSFGTAKRRIRCYALIGFRDSPDEAWDRCEWIQSHGILVLPMWHHALDQLQQNLVRDDQKKSGWTDYERRRIMGYFYQHRATPSSRK